MKLRHKNNGDCQRCEEILNRYPNFYRPMYDWFKTLQKAHPEAHLSCAGRNADDQEAAKAAGASRAGWGKSPHNYNAAIDIFVQLPGSKNIYDENWFRTVLAQNLGNTVDWLGDPNFWVGVPPKNQFVELPHVQPKGWKTLKRTEVIALLETESNIQFAQKDFPPQFQVVAEVLRTQAPSGSPV